MATYAVEQYQGGNQIAMAGKNGGALAASEQQRSIAEVQGAMVVAKNFPRNVVDARDRILNACTRPKLAEKALYAYSRGGSEITGPSIRLAEAIAQQWGNLQFGVRELSRGVDSDGVTYSEVEAYCWDIETNTKKPAQFRVRHWRDKKNNQGYKITDERDIYELVANQGARRLRACILAIIPGDIVEDATNQCEETLKANVQITPEKLKSLFDAFLAFGVKREQIEKRIQRRADTITPAQVIQLRKIYSSISDGMSNPSDWFEQPVEEHAEKGVSGLSAKLKQKQAVAETTATIPIPPDGAPQGRHASTTESVENRLCSLCFDSGISLADAMKAIKNKFPSIKNSESVTEDALDWYAEYLAKGAE